MARGDSIKKVREAKVTARSKQKELQAAGQPRRAAERLAWDEVNRGRAAQSTGTAGGRSRVSKRKPTPLGSTRKTKTTGKTRK